VSDVDGLVETRPLIPNHAKERRVRRASLHLAILRVSPQHHHTAAYAHHGTGSRQQFPLRTLRPLRQISTSAIIAPFTTANHAKPRHSRPVAIHIESCLGV
jgi:hypothetical protein